MVEAQLVFFTTTKIARDAWQVSLMSRVPLACQYLFIGKTRFAHCSTFIAGRPDHRPPDYAD